MERAGPRICQSLAARDIFKVLLKPQDELHLVPVPNHSTANPEELALLGQQVCPRLSYCETYEDVFTALDVVMDVGEDAATEKLIVLCGSLYLIGHLFQNSNTSNL